MSVSRYHVRNLNIDTIRAVDPTLTRHVERLNIMGDALANAERVSKENDNSVEFSRFYGSLIHKLCDDQKILCQLILVYCKYLVKQISSSDHVRHGNLRELAKFARQLEVRADETLTQLAALRDTNQQQQP